MSLTSTEKYDATSKLLLRESEPIDVLLRPEGGGSNDPERETNTKVALIKLETVADRVSRRLKLDVSASDLLAQVSAEVEGTSDIVAITVRDPVARRAADIANAFAQEYVAFRQESARASIDEAAKLARARLASLSADERASDQGRELEARLRELEIASSLQTGGAEIVRQAAVPTTAATPRPVRTGVLAVILGLAFGAGLAGLRELVDRKLRDENQALAAFELPILATIPRPVRSSRTVLLDGDREIEEAYGTLAANVVFADRGSEAGAFLITSPRSGDGKTSAAFGLAKALKVLGKRVIVIEADLHHPRFVEAWDIEQPPGLSSLLAGVGELENELVPVDGPGAPRRGYSSDGAPSIRVLPAGPVPPNPSAMLSRPAMGQVLNQSRELADFVLIDSAPVGLVHDPLTLVNHVDGVILVARLAHTTRDAARRTRRLLGHVGARVLGVVLTGGERIPTYYGDPDARHYGRSHSKAGSKGATEVPEKAAGRA